MMGRTKQEILADLTWRCVEEIRAAEAAGQPLRFTRAELRELAETLETAGQVPDALDTPEARACRHAVRDRLHEQLSRLPEPRAAAMATERPRSTSGWLALRSRTAPRWLITGMSSALAVLVVALGSVNLWHHPRPEVKIRKVYAERPDDIQNMNEPRAHELIPRMVKNELDPTDERSLMWHMLVCPGCFHEYVALRHGEHRAAATRQELLQLVSR